MAILSDFKRGQFVGACVAGASVTKPAELFGVARSSVLKVTIAFEKKGKKQTPHWSKNLEESESCLIGTVGLLHELLERIPIIQLRKLQQTLMTVSRTQFPQKGTCTKPDFTGGLQSENHIKIDLKFPLVSIILFNPCIYSIKDRFEFVLDTKNWQ